MPASGEELASYFMHYEVQQTLLLCMLHICCPLNLIITLSSGNCNDMGEKRRPCSMLTGWAYNGHAIAISILVVYKLRTPHVAFWETSVSVVNKCRCYQKRCEYTGCAAVYVPGTEPTFTHDVECNITGSKLDDTYKLNYLLLLTPTV